jgi:tRNA threonylcarbamoyl adenosine modification protein (Sua5/YciO/YrdC/YwlC family)
MTELESALTILRDGGVVVIPTDTVYGIACSPRSVAAVARVFELKGRPSEKALPVLGDGVGALETVASFDERAQRLARTFWPGPLTLVLPRVRGFGHDLGGPGDGTIAVRVPQHPIALELLSLSGPLAVTSANRTEEPPATTLAEARDIFEDHVDDYIDGGVCRGLPSSVLSLVGPPTVLREGALARGEILAQA